MFEGKPPIAHHAQHCASGLFVDQELAAVSWSDLVTRLSAMQDLRVALAHVPATSRASFDALAAEHIANRRVFPLLGSKSAVNPVDSANGKATGAKYGSCAEIARPAVRGIA